jgi:hypothetical protein
VQRHNAIKTGEIENPTRATAVMRTLIAVTLPVPKHRMIRSLNRLEETVPPAIIMEINPA